MMKKLMIKNWLLGAVRFVFSPLTAFIGWTKRKISPPLKVRLTRNSLMISLPANHGGLLHVLPRPGGAFGVSKTFLVANEGKRYVLKMSAAGGLDELPEAVLFSDESDKSNQAPDTYELASYEKQSDAAHALLVLNKALTGNPLWKWGSWLFLVWLGWLFVTSYMEVSQKQAAGKPDVLGYGAVQEVMPVIPSEPAPFQATPSVNSQDTGNLSNYIYQQAIKVQDQAQKDALPPKVSVDNAAGLAAFGLKTAGSKGSGEGCDPKLAFKAPEK